MEWSSAPVDLYCERLGPGLWAEPLNALSNLAFVVAGAWLLQRMWARKEPGAVRALAVLLVLIGLGSGTFHTFATRWAEVLDVLFIGLYIYWFVACYARFRWAAPWWLALLCMGLFHGFGVLVALPFAASDFNGSVGYFPALAGLVLFGLLSTVKDGAARAGWFFAAAAVFAASLLLRTLDPSLCAAWPYGTHWAWHLLNALTLTLTTMGIRRSRSLRHPRY